ncbi:hypothetical protein [Pseudomonas lundensis]|uniref:hypothetical protein n=1 Tax=Pseudomonas lundensis TaxID=86185 RepID=UPI00065339F5|nr:hypothetical protein [Pseudomonas lundensis]KMM91958.1 hypothetical protein TU74_08135 [Pseudomonas lundensis]OZY47988.1 hypothetical protein CJF41_00695 [Pseudomonas lundensis]
MDDDKSADQFQEVLKLKLLVSRLHALSIANTETIMNLVSSMAQEPDLPSTLRSKMLDEFKGLKKQMDILDELSKIQVLNGGS